MSNDAIDAATQPGPAGTAPAQPRRKFGLALTAMICGCLAMAIGWAPYAGIVFGIAGIVLGAIALRKGQQKLMSWFGIGIGAAGLIFGGIMTWLILA